MSALDLVDFVEWLGKSKSGIIRVCDAEAKLKEMELGIDINSPELFDAITEANYYFVSGSSDLIIRGGNSE